MTAQTESAVRFEITDGVSATARKRRRVNTRKRNDRSCQYLYLA